MTQQSFSRVALGLRSLVLPFGNPTHRQARVSPIRWGNLAPSSSGGAHHCYSQHLNSTGASTSSAESRRGRENLNTSDDGYTHFGFKSVPLSAKERLVRGVFESVAPSYDVMNDAMSLSIHRLWKDAFVADLAPSPSMRIVDCAGGTGDITLRILSARAKHPLASDTDMQPVTVSDINPEMLRIGQERFQSKGISSNDVRFVEADAEALPFEDESIDAYVISFGMRNVPRPRVALEEAVRVLKPGGRFMMLEFAKVDNPLISAAYDAYSFNVIPVLGQVVAGDRASYEYLVESIRQFPDQSEFSAMMREAGLRAVTVKDYTFGVAAQYSGFKSVDGSSGNEKSSTGETVRERDRKPKEEAPTSPVT